MNYTIRKAKTSDIKDINNFLTRLIRDEKQYDDNINENCIIYSFYENIIHDDKNCILVVEENNKIIGYLYGFIQNNGDTYINDVAQLDTIFIDEKYRKLGIGNALIEEFKKWTKKQHVKYIELKVCNNNVNAISLYKKIGFVDTKTIMSLELENIDFSD
ncbi:MAG: GNAT family N-acetyltransferase [Firmicutes bacterium]|nr:GNAT family N-acetyltransferase [Bacillota bacterium]